MNTQDETVAKAPQLTAQQRVSLDAEFTAIDRALKRPGMTFHQRMKLAGQKRRELEARFAHMTGVAMTSGQIEAILKAAKASQ